MTRPLCFAAALALAAWNALPARAATMMADSTVADRWQLANGLEVVTRHIPGASGIAITVGYRSGLDDDPADRPGLATLLAEVVLTAPAGDIPERTGDEMESLRPLGWGLKVTRRQTLVTEGATRAQFPGVLAQTATRMRGVTVTDAALGAALATVRQRLGQKYFGSVDQMLFHQVREVARGTDGNGMVALAAAKALGALKAADVQKAIARACVPANAALAIAGDLAGLDLHAVVEHEFGGIAGGARLPDPSPPALDSATVVLARPEVTEPAGVIGLRAPALDDSLHPSFYLAMLLLGTRCNQAWGTPSAPLTSRFQYAVLDDPGFVRMFPRLGKDARDPRVLSNALGDLTSDLLQMTVTMDSYQDLRYSVLWLLGGPLPRHLRQSMRTDAAALNALSSGMASRALWGSDAFWAEYRRRLDPIVSPAFGAWSQYLVAPRNQARLLFVPRR
ncbi:MAG: insulinase family protein [Candidatus Eisenbacteria bacterium]|nr:insulinase family protein [Candidatus Eisenbacteria bacterium]